MHRLRTVSAAAAFCGTAAAAFAPVPATAQRLDPEQVYGRWGTSIVTIRTANTAGTGFFDDSGHLFTAYHVLDGSTAAQIEFADHRKASVLSVVFADKTLDLAILTASALPPPVKFRASDRRVIQAYGPRLGDYAALRPGHRLVVIGTPLGKYDQTVTQGGVSALRTEGGVAILQFDAGISHGSSGSPVFDDHGDVVGMVLRTDTAGQGLNFALAGKELKNRGGLPMPVVFKAPKEGGGFISEAVLLDALQKKQPSAINSARALIDAPNFSVHYDISNAQPPFALSQSDVETLIKSQIAESAPGAQIVSPEDEKKQLAELGKGPDLAISRLMIMDNAFRKLRVNIVLGRTSDGACVYLVQVMFNRPVITSAGLLLVDGWSNTNTDVVPVGHEPAPQILATLKIILRQFCADWTTANAVHRQVQ